MIPHGPSIELYEKWRAIVANSRHECALIDSHSGRRWSFQELCAEAEKFPEDEGPIVAPSGHNAEFVLRTLRSWQSGKITCPIESNHPSPELSDLPPSTAHLKLTSASSGPAKCVAFTALQLAADSVNIVSTMGLRRDWPNLACISLAHSYGFSNLILPLLLHGIPLVLVTAPLPEMIWRSSQLFPTMTLAAVPALWRTWHEANCLPQNLRIAISAGAALPLELERDIYQTRNLKIHNFYGSSECGGIAYDQSDLPRTEEALAGTPLDNVKLSLTSFGTLVVESGAVGETYWPAPNSQLSGGKFETSDLAEIRGNQILLRGRLNDVINIAGRKVPPEAIETALCAHPSVMECVVFGILDAARERSETVVACLNTRDSVAIGELAQFLSRSLPAWQIPRQWWFTSELSSNQRGKLSRSEWRQRFLTRIKPSPELKT